MEESNEILLQLLTDFKKGFAQKYKLYSDKPLGDGGFGTVYHAKDLYRGVDVAIKIFHDGIIPVGSERGWNITSRINHKQIAPTYTIESFSSIENKEFKAVISRFIPGKSLKEIFEWTNTLKDSEKSVVAEDLSYSLILSILDVVEQIHILGWGHGDLHEGNIMVFLKDISSHYIFSSILIDFDNTSIKTEFYSATEKDKIEKDCRLLKTRILRYIIIDWEWEQEIVKLLESYSTATELKLSFSYVLEFIKLLKKNKNLKEEINSIFTKLLHHSLTGYSPAGLLTVMGLISTKSGSGSLYNEILSDFKQSIKNQENWKVEASIEIIENGEIKNKLYREFFG